MSYISDPCGMPIFSSTINPVWQDEVVGCGLGSLDLTSVGADWVLSLLSTHCGPLFCKGKNQNTFLERAGKWHFHFYSQRRKWNQGQVLYWHHDNFPNHLSEFVLSFLLHASRCNLNRIFDTLLFWSNKTSTWFSVGHGWLASRCYISSSDFISVI